MRNAASRTCLLLLLTRVTAIAQAPVQVPLVNPGFEIPYGAVNHAANVTTITGQVAIGWIDNSSSSNATVQYGQETNNPHNGTSCQKIVVVNPGTTGVQRVTLQQQAPNAFPLKPGSIYTASVWMRGAPGLVARVFMMQSISPFKTLMANEVDLTANCSLAAGCASDQINVLTPLDGTTGPALSAPRYPITPAKRDETIVVYAFGFGLPQGGVLSGASYQAGALPTLPVCQIGGNAVSASFAGVIEPGFYQLNLKIANAPSGGNQLVCTYNGVSSPLGDLIAIQ